ncbi:hypothetical protein SEA_ZETA1847_63 [Microbacterium phage Zeta1847]|uniref:DUF4926 domain-containing protein n=1 Tax=Microbacterium phage Zeta1847 TaxID=2201444 RepID=A0A2Z4Q9M0_9CAUD|nr:hypothetical protein HOT46_gp63 [Microbacterium phage Zeta1847]AWY06697.1 hypothetical protein SEA_ZETA1847_63 [Microbacterium phage Zeta1847]
MSLYDGARVRLRADLPLLPAGALGTVVRTEPDGLIRVAFDVWEPARGTYRRATPRDGIDLVEPAELERLA